MSEHKVFTYKLVLLLGALLSQLASAEFLSAQDSIKTLTAKQGADANKCLVIQHKGLSLAVQQDQSVRFTAGSAPVPVCLETIDDSTMALVAATNQGSAKEYLCQEADAGYNAFESSSSYHYEVDNGTTKVNESSSFTANYKGFESGYKVFNATNCGLSPRVDGQEVVALLMAGAKEGPTTRALCAKAEEKLGGFFSRFPSWSDMFSFSGSSWFGSDQGENKEDGGTNYRLTVATVSGPLANLPETCLFTVVEGPNTTI